MKKGFYFVDDDYISYLKSKEIEARGFTTVPNVDYTSRKKFLYGTVLEIDGLTYFVPVSSYSKKQQDNILIMIKSRGKMEREGSLRFNYMIPVPIKCLRYFDFNKDPDVDEGRKRLLDKEYRFCKSKTAAIQRQAKRTYDRVIFAKDMVRDSHTRLIAASTPDASLVLLHGNHFIAAKKPAEFNCAVMEFLEK